MSATRMQRCSQPASHALPCCRPLCVQGMWAEREVPRMSAPMIREFEAVLDQENPDMFKWLTSQAGLPALQASARAWLICPGQGCTRGGPNMLGVGHLQQQRRSPWSCIHAQHRPACLQT